MHLIKGSIGYMMLYVLFTFYNMSGRVVSDIQTRAEGESLYIRYNTDANDILIAEISHTDYIAVNYTSCGGYTFLESQSSRL
jgi:hypothetical protein